MGKEQLILGSRFVVRCEVKYEATKAARVAFSLTVYRYILIIL